MTELPIERKQTMPKTIIRPKRLVMLNLTDPLPARTTSCLPAACLRHGQAPAS